MKSHLCSLFLLIAGLFPTIFPAGHISAQTAADQTLGALLNGDDLFRLRTEYARLKDSLGSDMLRLLAEMRLGVGFNRLDRAAGAMDSLLLTCQDALGQEASLNIASLRAMNLLNLGHYAAAGQAGADLVRALEPYVPFEAMFGLVFIERMGKGLANTPKPFVSRPAHDVRVPMRVDSVGRGQHVCLPVEVNGVTHDFIFDTGCSFGNFVTERYARDAGLRIVADSIPVSGMSVGYVKLATADSLRVGEITCHHPVFLVAPPDPQTDSLFSYDGILGYHFIRGVGEVVLDNENGTFLFPVHSTPCEPNLYFVSNQPYVRITCLGEPFDILFDTGNVKSDLGANFAERFPEAVSGLETHSVQRGGFGGVVAGRGVTLPRFAFMVSDTPVELRHTDVVLEIPGNHSVLMGSLGADFVLYFKRLTINYTTMSLRGERW